MISRLKGYIWSIEDDHIVVNIHDVGYHVFISKRTLMELQTQQFIEPEMKNASYDFYVHTAVREDSISLYGFLKSEEKELFELLLLVNGIGPKLAMSIISAAEPKQFVHDILSKNYKALSQIPGIGKKIAERLPLELSEKITKLGFANTAEIKATLSEMEQDIISALQNLQYKNHEAQMALDFAKEKTPKNATFELLLKTALSYFHRSHEKNV